MKQYLLILIVVALAVVAGCVGNNGADSDDYKFENSLFFTAPRSLPDARVKEEYTYSFCTPELTSTSQPCDVSATNPSGGSPPYSFTLGTGTGFQPFGLILNLNGLLKGTPTAEGEREFEVCVKDTAGNQECSTVKLKVKGIRPAVTVASITCVQVDVNQFGRGIYDIEASGTATGPEGASLFIDSSGSSGGGNDISQVCGSWGPSDRQTCERGAGDPETTSWSFLWTDMTETSTFNFEVGVSPLLFVGDGVGASGTKRASCPN